MAAYDVAIEIPPEFATSLAEEDLLRLARTVLASESVEAGAALSVVIADDTTVRDLNRRFRDQDETTDVLSFGLDNGPEFPTPPGSHRQTGEVVISLPTAERQARDSGHTLQDEVRHLLTHGILHILGYDHEAPDEAKVMREREEAFLQGWRH